jgi:hypothetical protein
MNNRSIRYYVTVKGENFFSDTENAEIVFHTINKSGTLAMESVLREAFAAHGRSNEFLSHYEIHGSLKEFIARVEKSKSRFVAGHYLFNALKTRANRIWITQFRHPLPKILSSYNWLKIKHKKLSSGPFASIEEFVMKTEGIEHSSISHFSLGWGRFRRSRSRGLTAKNMYEASIDTLESQVHTIGIAERFEESIFLFARLCGLPSVAPWIRDNRNPGRPLSTEISEHERKVIEEVYQYDYKLYEYASSRFERQLKEVSFDNQLDLYKKACLDQYNDRIFINC